VTVRPGVDIGGTGIKAALVDIDRGVLVGNRVRRATPRPAAPEAVASVVVDLVESLDCDGPVGFGFPGW
jgi:polyphosphate glucokinase